MTLLLRLIKAIYFYPGCTRGVVRARLSFIDAFHENVPLFFDVASQKQQRQRRPFPRQFHCMCVCVADKIVKNA